MASKIKKANYPKVTVLCCFVCLLLFLVAGCNSANGAFNKAQIIIEESELSSLYYEFASDGSYIRIDTNPLDFKDHYNSDALQLVKDVNNALGFSESLYEKMILTRALDGMQSDENENFKVSWTYHPDQGLNVFYEKKK